MPASRIERVEVITNPSAAISPEGSAGVINLVTRRRARTRARRRSARPRAARPRRAQPERRAVEAAGSPPPAISAIAASPPTRTPSSFAPASIRPPAASSTAGRIPASSRRNARRSDRPGRGRLRSRQEEPAQRRAQLSRGERRRPTATRPLSQRRCRPPPTTGPPTSTCRNAASTRARRGAAPLPGKDHELLAEVEVEPAACGREVDGRHRFRRGPASSERIRNDRRPHRLHGEARLQAPARARTAR